MDHQNDLQLRQRATTRLTIQQLRFVKLLELSAPELEETVVRELEENPALEVKDSADDMAAASELTADGTEYSESSEQLQRADFRHPDDVPMLRSDSRDKGFEISRADNSESIYDYLRRQLSERKLSENVRLAADYIIGNIDSNGYLSRSRRQIADDMAISAGLELSDAEIDEALNQVRSLEPHGVGAFDLRDCLLIQLKLMPPSESRDDAIAIISDYFEEFSMKHTHRLVSQLKIGSERVGNAVALILSLNPKPGAQLGSGSGLGAQTIVPDFIITVDEGEITVQLNNSSPELQIEESFSNAVARMERNARSRAARKGNEFIISRYNEARDFIALVRQRNETLFAVMTAIVKIQREYFLTEDIHTLRPMMIKDISAITGYDMSVVSRATNNKYASTPQGILPLRFFFTDSFGPEGEEFTNREVQAEISRLVEEEDKKHPLSDEKLRLALLKKGYDVSRRTVAKYRDRLKIPVARLRRDM